MTSRHAEKALLWIAVVGAVVAAAWMWSAPSTSPRVLDEVGTAPGVPSLGEAALETKAPDLDAGGRERIPNDAPGREDEAGSEPRAVLVRGSLILVDELGNEHPHEDGQLELSVWGPVVPERGAAEPGPDDAGLRKRLRRRHTTTVNVARGRWQELVPEHTARSCASGKLAGRPLFDLRVEELESGAPAVIELCVTGRALYPARMSVVDRETRRDLPAVKVVAIEPEDPRTHPGDLAPANAEADSPIELPAPAVDLRTYLVGATGYAWQRVPWSHLSAEPRVVELERAGGLAIQVVADCALEDWAVTLAAGGDTLARIPAEGSSPLWIEGVAPAEYRIALVPQASLVQGRVPSLAEALATVVAGETTEVVLRGLLGERPPAVGLAGRIRMAASWSAGGPHLVLSALGPSALWHLESGGILGLEVDRQDACWSFRNATVVAGGRYLLTERRTRFMREIEVGPQGTQALELEIPDPVAVGVEVVDRVTGEPIPSSELVWLPPTPAGVPSSPASRPLWVEATELESVFRARVPAWDRLEFEARAPGYAASVVTFRPRPGPSVGLRIPLERR